GGDRRHQVVACLDRRDEVRDVVLFQLRDRLAVPELEPRHAAAALRAHEGDLDAVVPEHRGQVPGEGGSGAVAVGGGEGGGSVAARAGSPKARPWVGARTAFARSIRCGKSTSQGCGGTYGHLVMKHMSQT